MRFFGNPRKPAEGKGQGKGKNQARLREDLETAPEQYRRYSRSSVDKQIFTVIFAKTFSLFLENLEDYLFQCFDTLGLLILIRVVSQHNQVMQGRRIHCLDAFFDRVNMLLWPRFKVAFDLNLDSVKRIDPSQVKKGSFAPHYVTLRYAELVAGLLTLNKPYQDDILTLNLRRLREQLEKNFLQCASSVAVPKAQMVFLVNNYQMIERVLSSRGHCNSEEATRFRDLANNQVGDGG